MLTTLPGRDQSLDGWITETFAALGRLPVDGPAPVVWPFTPFYSGNPFQQILHGAFADRALVAAPTFRAADLRSATEGWPADLPLVVHLHWLNQVLAQADSAATAEAALAAHGDLLETLHDRGARLVWTIHNVLPHDSRFEDHEIRLRQQVAERVDLIHVMSPRTEELTRPFFELPGTKLYHCDHPGYQGVYPDWITRAEARRRLRVPDEAMVVLLTGGLRPYKGMGELLSAIERVDGEIPGSVVLVMAGRPDPSPRTQALLARAALHPAVRLLPGTVPDSDLQVLMRACDIVALPYRRSLNSGVLALAFTFGRPVLLPDDAGSVPLVDGSVPGTTRAGLVYRSDSPDGLVEGLRACLTTDLDPLALGATQAGQRIHRTEVSERFASAMRTWVDTGIGS